MNTPSSTIQAVGIVGLSISAGLIVLALVSPEYYNRLPPGSEATLVALATTIIGYKKKENVLK